jgi:type IV pilus assembly protein PilC
MREEGPRARWDAFKLRAPLRIGPLVQKITVARFSRTFASLLRAGVPATEAMAIVAETSGNVLVADAVIKARDQMMAGSTIAEPLAQSSAFPTTVTRMIEIGEETGQLELMLVKVAEFFEEEVDLAIKSITSIIEPLMIIIVGAAIGIVILSIYLPMFGIYNKIGTGLVFIPLIANREARKALVAARLPRLAGRP